MNTIEKDAFIQTTIDSYKDENLENVIKQSKDQNKKLKSLTSSDNKLLQFMTLIVFFIVLFFILPVLLSGTLTKGMNLENWSIISLTIVLIVFLYMLKKSLL